MPKRVIAPPSLSVCHIVFHLYLSLNSIRWPHFLTKRGNLPTCLQLLFISCFLDVSPYW